MNPQDVLTTIAEVAIAIAGFGGVIAAIASVAPHGLSGVARSAFGGLLLGGIMLVFFSILPQILGATGVSDSTLWSVASGLHALYMTSVLVYRTRELQRAGGSFVSLGYILPLTSGVAMIQIVNAVWVHAAWLYMAVLLVVLLGVFALFPRLLGEIWRPASAP